MNKKSILSKVKDKLAMDYTQQVMGIEKMIDKLPNEEKKVFKDKFDKAMKLSGSVHRIKLTALHSELEKKLGVK